MNNVGKVLAAAFWLWVLYVSIPWVIEGGSVLAVIGGVAFVLAVVLAWGFLWGLVRSMFLRHP